LAWFARQSSPVKLILTLLGLVVFFQLYVRYILPLSGEHAVGSGSIGNNGLAPASDIDSFLESGDLRGGGKNKRRRKKKHADSNGEARAQGGIKKAGAPDSHKITTTASTIINTLPVSLDVCDHAACTGQTKVIAISLYGGNPRYTSGAVRNSEIMRDAFPDWQLWVYQPDPAVNREYEVPGPIVETLQANGAKIIIVDKKTIDQVGFGMNQRFLPAEDPKVDRFASRDGDSR
jgi:hypothetical protein